MSTARATSFGAWADDYDRWRPTYPGPAVEWLVPPHGTRVVEIGAGTGKLTDRLVGRGLELDVVEPDGRMLALVSARHPSVRTHETMATDLPFRWTWTRTTQQWRGFVSTVSHVRLLPDGERNAALDETEQLVAQACEAAGATAVPLTHDAVCVRWYPEQ